MIHSGGRGSKGPYERGGDGEVDGSAREAKGCMDAAATDAQAGSTLGSGCCAAMAHAWMEEFSGDSTLCRNKVTLLVHVIRGVSWLSCVSP